MDCRSYNRNYLPIIYLVEEREDKQSGNWHFLCYKVRNCAVLAKGDRKEFILEKDNVGQLEPECKDASKSLDASFK